MESSGETNPFAQPTATPEPTFDHLDRLIECMESENETGWIFWKRKQIINTCHRCTRSFFFGCNHCRLCGEIFCKLCCIYVSDSLIVPLHHLRGRGGELRNVTIKVCQACNDLVQDDWRIFTNGLHGDEHQRIIQKNHALRKQAEVAIKRYNIEVTEIRQGNKLHTNSSLIRQRDAICAMLEEFDDNIYILARHRREGSCFGRAQYSSHFEQFKIDLDRLKDSMVNDLSFLERTGITIKRIPHRIRLHCCCCCLYHRSSPEYRYLDDVNGPIN